MSKYLCPRSANALVYRSLDPLRVTYRAHSLAVDRNVWSQLIASVPTGLGLQPF